MRAQLFRSTVTFCDAQRRAAETLAKKIERHTVVELMPTAV
jgi:hypothetical protein